MKFLFSLLLPVAALCAQQGFGNPNAPASVPANSGRPAPDSAIHHIGERFGGGIVFYIYDHGKHGLIAATSDQRAGVPWYNGLTRYTGAHADGLGEGANNTKIIISKLIKDDENGFFAAKVCADYSVKAGGIVYKDWYLPSKYELSLLYRRKKTVGGFRNENYWSSTEYKSNSVWIQRFGSGDQLVSNSEAYANNVRAIRAF
jgi:hypothetical protein